MIDKAPGARTAVLVLLVLNLMWGGSLPATKLGLAEFSPFALSWLRLAVSSVLFLLVLLPGREWRDLGARDWLALLALGVLGYSGTIGLQTLGTSGTTGASAAVLGSTGPLFISMGAMALLGERLTWKAVAGLLIALGGVAVVLGLDPRDPGLVAGERLVGNVLVLASSACFGLYSVVGKGALERRSPLVVGAVTCLGGVLGLTPLAIHEAAAGLPQPGLLGLAMLAYLGVMVTFVGMLAWFWALRVVPASRGGAFLFLQPVSGVLLAALGLGDLLSPSFLLGTALVLAGLYVVTRG
jgi:drug/metabolite transporter (DMT)-like permease